MVRVPITFLCACRCFCVWQKHKMRSLHCVLHDGVTLHACTLFGDICGRPGLLPMCRGRRMSIICMMVWTSHKILGKQIVSLLNRDLTSGLTASRGSTLSPRERARLDSASTLLACESKKTLMSTFVARDPRLVTRARQDSGSCARSTGISARHAIPRIILC